MADTPVTITEKQRFWMSRIQASEKREESWRNEGKHIVMLYRDEGHLRHRGHDGHKNNHRRSPIRPFAHHHANPDFNILWSNTEILKPATLSAMPEPDVRRRYNVENPIALNAADILEKSLSFMADEDQFLDIFKQARDDFLLPGRGVLRARYNADIRRFELERVSEKTIDESGNEVTEEMFKRGDEFLMPDGFEVEGELFDADTEGARPFIELKVGETVFPEYVFWEDFLMSDHRNWEDVVKEGWIAFRHEFDKRQLREVFGAEVAKKIKPPEVKEPMEDKGSDVWEIWDSVKKQVVWLSMNGLDVLEEVDDPLELKGFYPIPKPLYPFETTDTLEPVPLFRIYESQAHELNTVEARLHRLTRALKATGIYNGANADDFANLASGSDGTLIPVKSLAEITGGSGSLAQQIVWMPIQQIAATIGELRLRKQELKQEIFELTGISDIIRGSSDPSESAAAARLKGGFGELRLRPLRDPIEQLFREFYRIAGELMAEKFDKTTFVKITGADIDDNVMALLKSDQLREFRIDVETDSTVQPNAEIQRGQATEFAGVMSGLLSGVSDFLTGQPPQIQDIMAPVVFETMKATVRQFKVGRSVEDELNTALEKFTQLIQGQLQQPPEQEAGPDPLQIADLQLKAQGMEQNAQNSQDREATIRRGQDADLIKQRETNETAIVKNILDVAAAGQPIPRIG